MTDLLGKYNIPAPRYTSYPTVPLWDGEDFNEKRWIRSLQKGIVSFGRKKGIGLYIHLPFCESMCTFCGCNKRITKNHSVEEPYLQSILKEWNLYLERLPVKPLITELHLGGGTPTFFSPSNLEYLVESILEKANVPEKPKFSFEGHPNNTTKEHLQVLFNLGFRRVSFGIQDFDPIVQKAINRIQTFRQVEEVTELSRKIGYSSINYDVIYGLPFQQINSVVDTMNKVNLLIPDRIAYYSYAHVPWLKGIGQRKFSEKDLPSFELKHAQYQKGRELLTARDYKEVAMDHFSLPGDDLLSAYEQGKLNRNFMGYTNEETAITIGLGASSIGDSFYGMSQNVKNIDSYHRLINDGFLPLEKGHLMTEEDILMREAIHDLMCKHETTMPDSFPKRAQILNRLSEPFSDDLLRFEADRIIITEKGKPYLRNICMAFDLRLVDNQPTSRIFSMAV